MSSQRQNAARIATRLSPLAIDTALAVILAALMLPLDYSTIIGSGLGTAWTVGIFAVLVVVHGSVAARRQAPMTAYLISCAAMLILAFAPAIQASGGSAPALLLPSSLVYFVLLYSVAAYKDARPAGIAAAIAILGVNLSVTKIGLQVRLPGQDLPLLWLIAGVILLIAVIGVWFGGRWRSTRIAYLAELETATRRDERSRIARELHDVVSHSLAVMIAQAEGGRMSTGALDSQAAAAFGAIADTGRDALGDMRAMVDLLRDPEAPEHHHLSPQPGINNIPALIESVQAGGLNLTYTTTGPARPISPHLGLVVYRIIQEALTNVVKHAGASSTASVELAWDDQLRIAVRDNGCGSLDNSGTKVGLVGLQERLSSVGGSLVTEQNDHGFALHATIALPATTAAKEPR